jgi:hypothetical protein
MKTYKKWIKSGKGLSSFLSIGDEVDSLIVDYVLSVLPPVTWTKTIIQMGEPYTYNYKRYPCYLTLEKIGENWTYAGIWPTPKNQARFATYFQIHDI